MGSAEPGWRPHPACCGVEARPRSAEDGRDLFLRQLLDQGVQFLALGAHGISVRTQPDFGDWGGKAIQDGSLWLIVALKINNRQPESR